MRYFQKRKRCGKEKCRTCQEAGGHGPYWFASQTINGQTVETYIGKQLPAEIPEKVSRATRQSPFIGREDQLAHLVQILDRIERIKYTRKSSVHQKLSTGAHAVLFTGETGIGKTRLAEEIAHEATLRHWSVIWVKVLQESPAPYRLWSEMLRTALTQGLWKRLGILRQRERYRPLRLLLPDVLDLWPEETRPSEQLPLWEATRMLLSTMSDKTTVLVVFDDLHWADDQSCELLDYLTQQMRQRRLLFLCTCCESQLTSDHPLHHLLTGSQEERMIEVLPITPLRTEQVQELISYAPASLAQRIALHADGNPLFAEELARSSLAGDLFDSAYSARPEELPTTISTVLALRLTHLSSECQRLLECGAVLGDVFPCIAAYAIGNEVMHLDEESLIDLLEEAIQAGTIIEEGSGNTITYHFWHPLLRTYLYNHLSAARRASLHRRAANVLQDFANGREEEFAAQIANHLEQGGASSNLIAHFQEMAAHHAYSLSAYKDAAHFYQRVLGHIRMMPKTPEQQDHEARLLEFLAECTRIQGDPGLARAYYEQALQLHQTAELQGDRQSAQVQALLWAEIGLCWFDEGDLAQAKRYYALGEKRLHDADLADSTAWAKVRYEQSYCALCEGKYQEAHSLALEAFAVFARENEANNAFSSHMTRLQRTLASDPVDLGRVHMLLGLIANGDGQPNEALQELLKAYAIYVEHHQTRELAIVCCNVGDLYMRRGAYEHATEALEQALNLAEKMGNLSLSSFTIGNLGIIALRQQNLSLATTRLIQAFQGAEQCNEKASMSYWSSYAGQVALAQGQREKARGHLVQALTYARQCHFEPYLAIALITSAYFHLGSHLHMRLACGKSGSYKKAKKALQRVLALSTEAETRIEAQFVTACLATLEGDRETSQTLARAALNEAKQCGVEWLVPFAREMLP